MPQLKGELLKTRPGTAATWPAGASANNDGNEI